MVIDVLRTFNDSHHQSLVVTLMTTTTERLSKDQSMSPQLHPS